MENLLHWGVGGPHEEDPRTLRAKAGLAKSQEYSARTPHLLAYLKVSGRDMPCLGSGIGEAGILECLLNILVWCQSVREVIRAVTLWPKSHGMVWLYRCMEH